MGQVGLSRLLASSNNCLQDGWILNGMAELDTCLGVVECSPQEKHLPRREAFITLVGWGSNRLTYY